MTSAKRDVRTRQETGEEAYRRIARRKLNERGVPEVEIDVRLEEIMKTDVRFRFDLDTILGKGSPS